VSAGPECSLLGNTGSWKHRALRARRARLRPPDGNQWRHLQPPPPRPASLHYHGMPDTVLGQARRWSDPKPVSWGGVRLRTDGTLPRATPPTRVRYGYRAADRRCSSSSRTMKSAYTAQGGPRLRRPPRSTYRWAVHGRTTSTWRGLAISTSATPRGCGLTEFPLWDGRTTDYVTDNIPFIKRCPQGNGD